MVTFLLAALALSCLAQGISLTPGGFNEHIPPVHLQDFGCPESDQKAFNITLSGSTFTYTFQCDKKSSTANFIEPVLPTYGIEACAAECSEQHQEADDEEGKCQSFTYRSMGEGPGFCLLSKETGLYDKEGFNSGILTEVTNRPLVTDLYSAVSSAYDLDCPSSNNTKVADPEFTQYIYSLKCGLGFSESSGFSEVIIAGCVDTSEAECANQCSFANVFADPNPDGSPRCRAWSYREQDHKCLMYKSVQGLQLSTGFNSGVLVESKAQDIEGVEAAKRKYELRRREESC